MKSKAISKITYGITKVAYREGSWIHLLHGLDHEHRLSDYFHGDIHIMTFQRTPDMCRA